MVRIDPIGEVVIQSQAEEAEIENPPMLFREVLQKWKRMQMWDNIQWVGGDNWIAGSIAANTCITVTDGSYMKSLYPNVHLAAFVLECNRGGGRLWGSFPEASKHTCSYRGELIGLVAIHLILLLSTNKVNNNLPGSVEIFSDCLGTLDKMKNLPPSGQHPEEHTCHLLPPHL